MKHYAVIFFAKIIFQNEVTASFVANMAPSKIVGVKMISPSFTPPLERKTSIVYNSVTSPQLTTPYSSITITIPQFLPDQITPVHKNSYPSPLHKIHVCPLLTKEEAAKCLEIAESHAERTSCWKQKDTDRHASYSTADFPIEECDEFNSYLEKIDFDSRLWDLISEKYDVDVDDLSFLDFFCAHYEAKDDDGARTNGVMDRLEPHRDGTLLSFTIVLSDSQSYHGGGTIFDALRDMNPSDNPQYDGILCDNGVVRVKNPGDAVLHSGKIKHGGNVVTKGERTVLVGFVDVHERCVRDGVLKEACKQWGRSDVAHNRVKRQQMMMLEDLNNSSGGWYRNENNKLVKNKSCFVSFVPAFASVENRANEEKIRLRNLRAEDMLLRDILLHRNERKNGIPDDILKQFGGEITIL